MAELAIIDALSCEQGGYIKVMLFCGYLFQPAEWMARAFGKSLPVGIGGKPDTQAPQEWGFIDILVQCQCTAIICNFLVF